jgi:Rieske Fe-S protein
MVSVEDLPPSSKKKVNVQCDYCGEIFQKQYCHYCKEKTDEIPKTVCEKCHGLKIQEIRRLHAKQWVYDDFIAICKEKGYTPITKQDEIVDSSTFLTYICPIHGEQYRKLSYIKREGCHDCKVEKRKHKYAEEQIALFYQLCQERGYTPISTVNDFVNESSYLYYLCPIHGL